MQINNGIGFLPNLPYIFFTRIFILNSTLNGFKIKDAKLISYLHLQDISTDSYDTAIQHIK